MARFRRKDIRAGEAIRFVFNKKGDTGYHCGISDTSQKTAQFGYGLFYVDEEFWHQTRTMAREFSEYGLSNILDSIKYT